MKKSMRVVFFTSVSIATVGFLIYLFVSNDLTLLQPKGIIAEQQRDLLVFASILSLLVVIPVFTLTLFITLRYRDTNKKARYEPDFGHSKKLETMWWGIPIAIILVLSVITWRTSHSLDPYRPLASEQEPLKVQVVSLQWKWLFIYPDQRIASVNYLHIPKDRPVEFSLTSDAPMNSFWIPELGGQIYSMPGMATKLHLMANDIGSYNGYSANISGDGFAKMRFTAQSSSNEEFDEWVSSMKLSDYTLNDRTYAALREPTSEITIYNYSLGKENLFSNIINSYAPHYIKDSTEPHYIHGGSS